MQAQFQGAYEISTDPERLDLKIIHDFLALESYWASGIARAAVETSIRNSLCFGLYHGAAQVGFARVVTDKARFALLADVFVLAGHRGKGLSKWLLQTILSHEELQGLRRVLLMTLDAHGLYSQFGFMPITEPARFMEILG